MGSNSSAASAANFVATAPKATLQRLREAYLIASMNGLEAAGRYLGCSREWARLCFRAMGLPRTRRRRRPPERNYSQRRLDRAAQAQTLTEAARVLGLWPETAERELERRGIAVPKRLPLTKRVAPKLLRRVVEGYKAREFGLNAAARLLGCSRGCVKALLLDEGVLLNPKYMMLHPERRRKRKKRGK